MDSYLHTPLASSTMLSRSMPATSHMMKPPIRAIPESNPDVDCKALLTPDGTYRLQQEVYFSTIPPQYATGTHASLIENERKKSPSQGSCDAGVARTFSRSPAFEGLPEHTEPVFHVGGEEENGLESDAGPGILPQLLLAENKDIGSPGINITTPYNVPTLADPDIPTASRTLTRSSSMSSTDGSSDLSPSPLSHSTSVASTNSYFPEIMSPTNSRRFPNSYVDIERSQTMFLSTTRETNADDDHLPITQTFSHGWSVGSFSSFSHHGSHHHAHHHHHHHNHNHHHPSRHHIKRPKNSLIKSKSSLIERVVVYEQLPKVLASRSPRDRYLFFNVGSNFIWMDANDHPKEPLTRIVFSGGHPTCHDVNAMTMSDEHMDVIIGFSSGDFIWYDPINTRYSRLNKNGSMNASAVTMVKWIPGSEDLFMASFRDGSVMIFDKDRDDQPFTPSAPRSWAEEQFQVTTPHKHPKHNPVSHWRVSEKSVAGFAFSPNGSHVAIVGEDGLLRTVNYSEERLCDVFGGYYGKLLCVAWSPDNQYILTGGQDDLVTIWAFREQKIVARCQGHKSWVTGVAFDPWQCNEQVYRFASVGEDCTLILWDFSVSALHRPKQSNRLSVASAGKRFSILRPALKMPEEVAEDKKESWRQQLRSLSLSGDPSSLFSENGKALNLFRRRSTMGGKKATVPSTPAEVEKPYHVQLPTIHPVPNKTQVPYLQPITVQTVHADPCVDILFRQDCIVTTDRRGRLRKWGRPQQ